MRPGTPSLAKSPMTRGYCELRHAPAARLLLFIIICWSSSTLFLGVYPTPLFSPPRAPVALRARPSVCLAAPQAAGHASLPASPRLIHPPWPLVLVHATYTPASCFPLAPLPTAGAAAHTLPSLDALIAPPCAFVTDVTTPSKRPHIYQKKTVCKHTK